ncbi:dihydrofolate reductase family protein [Dyella caseinilytica]|uniref:Dihydrofolate reductase n=1 Tax=Dyella caseinilytica TaxID=1849581 RepID=A0ABX7GNW2_9GAMM|nr:dihydrofolate reductase family protein [Dyella caseinilytica]QRN52114.1 dihydrofolate reductase [Dyella caseinilytica]GGA15285.1 riboflavin biosynthesis protein RibD [Dyella caseinilytica]
MGKLIMWNLVTLDGYFEGPKSWDLEFHQHVWGDDLERFAIEQLESAEGLLFGRITYEGMAAYWKTAEGTVADFMNNLPKLVASRTLRKPDWNNTGLVSENIADTVREAKQQAKKDLYVFGSANLSETLIEENLFDEYRIGLVPVILGSGNPLFKQGVSMQQLSLIGSHTYQSGCAVLRYVPKS